MSQLHQVLQAAQQHSEIQIPDTWGQGRATYGGLIAAILVSHLIGRVGAAQVLRSATVSFVAPALAGQATLSAEVLRSGKSATQAEARLMQAGHVVAVLLASFGLPRESGIQVEPIHAAPEFKAAAPLDVPQMPYIAGMMPEFFQHLDIRWAKGKPPFVGATRPDFAGWMRYQDQSLPEFGLAHVFGLIDAWPPAVLPMFKQPAPASSLCWTLEWIQQPVGYSAADFWRYAVRTDAADAGYAHTEAHIWDAAGRLVAISRQTISIFA
ncbi:MAG: thioesterase family protein [Pseudomonadota bacterium]|nr:thioesterase family protein [Pseudomonadota bacterium]